MPLPPDDDSSDEEDDDEDENDQDATDTAAAVASPLADGDDDSNDGGPNSVLLPAVLQNVQEFLTADPAALQFCRGVTEMVITAKSEGHPAENCVLEIRSFKFAQNKVPHCRVRWCHCF